MSHPSTDLIVLDTLGKLAAHGHGLFGCCQACGRHFDVLIAAVIARCGADSSVIGMRPFACPICRGLRTEFRITAPSKGSRA